ncbi:MAG: hypothetical protein ABIS47_14440 [Acidimicrobiales bacterium]
MVSLDAATVLLQWATGGLLFLWVTTRRRLVGIGYGWLLRATFGVMAAGALWAGRVGNPVPGRDAACVGVVLATASALVVSVVRRRAGVSGPRAVVERRKARVAVAVAPGAEPVPATDQPRAEFPPALDLVAPALGLVGLVAAAIAAQGPTGLTLVRTLVGAAFLGSVSDAMLLGHWYLVQPGLGRGPINELNRWLQILWPFEVVALLLPTGMLSVLSGAIDDGYGGILGWFWVACAVTTIGLSVVTTLALRERAYSAVMAATGLLYLAILTAFGTDLVARLVLSG